jgi:23S rRNA-/tRNA-specific pseudouridylate synthase
MSPPVRPPLNFQASEEGPASVLIARYHEQSIKEVRALLDLGAVYVNRARLSGDVLLRFGDHVRVHCNPRRFPAGEIRWEERIVAETPDFVVVDKPGGVPTHPTCDNAVENAVYQVGRVLGSRPWVVHRLDLSTQGLMVFAKHRVFTRRFQEWIAEQKVRKEYRALVEREVGTGDRIHYMAPGDRAPRVLSTEPCEGWKLCALRILSSRPLGEKRFELRIRLMTGRMHQIRSQLAALDAPILGDELYGSRAQAPKDSGVGERIALQSCALAFPDENGGERVFELPANWKLDD